MYEFGLILPQVTETCGTPNPVYRCYICEVARQHGTAISKPLRGQPPLKSTVERMDNNQQCVRLCVSCKSPIGRGLSHCCNVPTLRKM